MLPPTTVKTTLLGGGKTFATKDTNWFAVTRSLAQRMLHQRNDLRLHQHTVGTLHIRSTLILRWSTNQSTDRP